MKLTNERKSNDVVYDIDLTDEEEEYFISYGKKHITDEALIEFAIVDILKTQVEKEELLSTVNIITNVMANAAELGCPRNKDVDMWFREMTNDEKCETLKKLEKILERNYVV